DPVLSQRLPNTDGMKNKVLIYESDRGYKSDVAIRSTGATIVNIGEGFGNAEQTFRTTIDDHTAAIFAHDAPQPSKLSPDRMVAIAQEYKIPVLIDAAFSVPPKRKLWEFTRDGGVDAVFISGGKGLRGPQSTGLVLGKPWLIKACAFH